VSRELFLNTYFNAFESLESCLRTKISSKKHLFKLPLQIKAVFRFTYVKKSHIGWGRETE